MAIEDHYTIDYNAQTVRYTGSWTGDYPDNIYQMLDWYKWLMGEIDEPDDPVDHGVSQRDEGIDETQLKSVDHLL